MSSEQFGLQITKIVKALIDFYNIRENRDIDLTNAMLRCFTVLWIVMLTACSTVSQSLNQNEREIQLAESEFIQEISKATVLIKNYSNTYNGVIISPNGYIITTSHGINNGLQRVYLFNDKVYPAKQIYCEDRIDLCLFKIETETYLPFLPIAHNHDVMDSVFIIGKLSNRSLYTTEGKILLKDIDMKLNHRQLEKGIIHSAGIVTGFSGGPVLNNRGELLGINLAYFQSPQARKVASLSLMEYAVFINNVIKMHQVFNNKKRKNKMEKYSELIQLYSSGLQAN